MIIEDLKDLKDLQKSNKNTSSSNITNCVICGKSHNINNDVICINVRGIFQAFCTMCISNAMTAHLRQKETTTLSSISPTSNASNTPNSDFASPEMDRIFEQKGIDL